MANPRAIVRFDQQRESTVFTQTRPNVNFGLARIVGGINWALTRTSVEFGIPYPVSLDIDLPEGYKIVLDHAGKYVVDHEGKYVIAKSE